MLLTPHVSMLASPRASPQLKSLDGIRQCPSLRVVSANTNAIMTFPTSTVSSASTALQHLSLYHNHLTSLGPGALQGLSNLTSLDLGRYVSAGGWGGGDESMTLLESPTWHSPSASFFWAGTV